MLAYTKTYDITVQVSNRQVGVSLAVSFALPLPLP